MEEDLDLLPDKPYRLSDEMWESISNRRRIQVYDIAEAQWWLCYHCNLPIDKVSVSRDHLVPKAKGGKGNDANIVATCVGCNVKKGDKPAPPERYIRLRQRQYYRELGLWATKPRRHWAKIFPGFGVGPNGETLFAPQIGII
jgi:5-methylcytosine-specific restriction endonuclease McrA